MTRYYHQRFFVDVRVTSVAVFALLIIGWWGVPESFLLIPIAALIGANQTAFDASYLHFSRHYAAALESELNRGVRRKLLVGAELEDRYLFPLNERKLVAAHLGSGFSWFGWMTIFYTITGILAFLAGLALGWSTLTDAGRAWTIFYLGSLGLLVLLSLAIGGWWFVSGVGERRLREVLGDQFGQPLTNGGASRVD